MSRSGLSAGWAQIKRSRMVAGRVDTNARDKLRGGYYTPMAIARWMCGWAVRAATDRVLEPSAGDGNFLVAAAEAMRARGAAIALSMRTGPSADDVTAIEAHLRFRNRDAR